MQYCAWTGAIECCARIARSLCAAIVVAAVFICAPAIAQQSTPPILFSYQPTGTDADITAGVPVTFNLSELRNAVPGSLVNFLTPGGRSYLFVVDDIKISASGNVHWIAHFNGTSGDNYRAFVTWGVGGFGTVATPDGNFKLETVNGVPRLVDLAKVPRRQRDHGDDAVAPPVRKIPAASPTSSALIAAPVAAAGPGLGNTQIDVMVVYTNSYAARLGPDNMLTRIEYLIGLANQAYVDSGVSIQLNLLHSAPVAYTNVAIGTALNDLTNGTNGLAGTHSLRAAYGADLVVLLKEVDSSVDPSSVGLAWVIGAGGLGPQSTPEYGFAVVDDGSDIRGTGEYAGDYAFAHELGHNMGAQHDRAHASFEGAFAYSYGYGSTVAPLFGTIMSYLSPVVGKFSNPALNCTASPVLPCGVNAADTVNGANNALTLNNTRATVAAFATATGLNTTPNNFSFVPLIGVTAGATLLSETFTIGGLMAAGGVAAGANATISITGGLYSIDGGAFTSATGTVTNGQTVQVQIVAPATAYAVATAYLTIGSVTRAFKVVSNPPAFATIPMVAAGTNHSLALRADGVLFAWGNNAKGQLGDGNPPPASSAQYQILPEALSMQSVASISARGDASLALKSDGTVWAWGDNTYEQLGTPTPTSSNVPLQVPGLSGISRISMGEFGSLALKNDGTVYAWGFWNGASAVFQVTGTAQLPLPAVSAIAAGSQFGLLLSGGTIWSSGFNNLGQLGNGTTTTSINLAKPVPSLAGVIAIAAGSNHGLALKSDGTVWTWGGNASGQLGIGTVDSNPHTSPVMVTGLPTIVAIVAGNAQSFAIGIDGSLWAWGGNASGQLGDGSVTSPRTSPAKIAFANSNANVIAVSGDWFHGLGLLSDGSVWAWGNNFYGQLGNNSRNQFTSPTLVGSAFWYIGTADSQPSTFSFGAQAKARPGAAATSASTTIAGMSIPTPISASGGTYSINGGAFVSTEGTVKNGDQVRVQVIAASLPGATAVATVTIGGVSAGFSVVAQLAVRMDFDGNGIADVLLRHASGANYIWMLNGTTVNGNSGFLPSLDSSWSISGVGDFDGDGKADVLLQHTSGANYIWMLNGTTVNGNSGFLPSLDASWSISGVGDFDGDGKSDILLRHTSGANYIWMLNGTAVNGNSGFLPSLDSSWSISGVGDFDGDGKSDILLRHTSGANYVWTLNGTTINGNSGFLPSLDASWSISGVGDFDGDGKSDILLRHTSGANYIWMLHGTTVQPNSGFLPSLDASWSIAGTGDYNGDGKSDVLLKHTSGANYIWMLNGTTVQGDSGFLPSLDSSWSVVNK